MFIYNYICLYIIYILIIYIYICLYIIYILIIYNYIIIIRFLYKIKKRPIYAHKTCATDTDNINLVFNDVADVVLKKQLREIALL